MNALFLIDELFRKKWFLYSWPVLLLLLSAAFWLVLYIIYGRSPDWQVLLWLPLSIYVAIIKLDQKLLLYGLIVGPLLLLSLLWWFWRPGWPSWLFSLFVVFFVGGIPGIFIYTWGQYMNLSVRLHAWLLNLPGM